MARLFIEIFHKYESLSLYTAARTMSSLFELQQKIYLVSCILRVVLKYSCQSSLVASQVISILIIEL